MGMEEWQEAEHFTHFHYTFSGAWGFNLLNKKHIWVESCNTLIHVITVSCNTLIMG